MRKLLLSILIVFIASPAILLYGQRYVDVAPDESGEIGALNNAIANDTEADANTIYRLRRGARYILNGPIINASLPLRIEAEAGEGDLPQLTPGLTIDGTTGPPFRPLNDLYIKNLNVTARAQGGGLEDQIIRIQAEDIRVQVDSCFIDESSQSFIRTDTRGVNIFITNTVVGRMGTPDDIDNGRVVDDRGNFIDTLVMENNTIYNITSRVVRDGAGSDSYINKVVFNQNTVLNVGQRMADFGPVIDFIFTNNIIVNPSFTGRGIDPDPFNPEEPEPNPGHGTAAIIVDSVAQSILDQANRVQTADVRNNNIYYTQDLLDARPERNPDPADDSFIVNRETYSLALEAFIDQNDTRDTNIEEVLDFSNAPLDPTVFARQFWENFDGMQQVDQWDNTGAPFSFQYPEATISATAGTDGGQLGDMNWALLVISRGALEELIIEADTLLAQNTIGFNIGNIPLEFADSLQIIVDQAKSLLSNSSATEEDISNMIDLLQSGIDYFLSGLITSTDRLVDNELIVYPNPSTHAVFITGNDLISVRLYDISGKTMQYHLINHNSVDIDISASKQGLYFLEITKVGGSVVTKKIIKQ